jgi:hypothetical protein
MQSVIDFPWKYSHVDDDKQVSAGPCVLHTITINRLDTGDVTATVYDNPAAAGNVIAVIHLNGSDAVNLAPTTLTFDVKCATGLYIDFSAVATADLTVSYH